MSTKPMTSQTKYRVRAHTLENGRACRPGSRRHRGTIVKICNHSRDYDHVGYSSDVFRIQICQEYQRAVVFRLGRFQAVRGPVGMEIQFIEWQKA